MSGGGSFSRLDYAERWLRDGLAVLRPPMSVYLATFDMTAAMARLEALKSQSPAVSPTSLFIHAVARALRENPGLHQVIAGRSRFRPATVDVGISIAGKSFVAPVLVIREADRKDPGQIAGEIAARSPEVRAADERLYSLLQRWGWLIPFGMVRRLILRTVFRSPGFRHRGVGSIQISTTPTESGIASTFSATAVLVLGPVMSKPMAHQGQVVVRPAMTVTLSGDHGVWDGKAAARFLAAVRDVLDEPHA